LGLSGQTAAGLLGESSMSIETLLLLIVVFLVVGVLPSWPYSKSWGYGPTGIFTLLLILFLVWAIAADRPLFRSGHNLRSAGHDMADSMRHAFDR